MICENDHGNDNCRWTSSWLSAARRIKLARMPPPPNNGPGSELIYGSIWASKDGHPGAGYRVMRGGNDGHNIFIDKQDRIRFCELLRKRVQRFDARVPSLCLIAAMTTSGLL